MTTHGHIAIHGKPIKIQVNENQFFRTIQLRTVELDKRLPEAENYFRDNPKQLEKAYKRRNYYGLGGIINGRNRA